MILSRRSSSRAVSRPVVSDGVTVAITESPGWRPRGASRGRRSPSGVEVPGGSGDAGASSWPVRTRRRTGVCAGVCTSRGSGGCPCGVADVCEPGRMRQALAGRQRRGVPRGLPTLSETGTLPDGRARRRTFARAAFAAPPATRCGPRTSSAAGGGPPFTYGTAAGPPALARRPLWLPGKPPVRWPARPPSRSTGTSSRNGRDHGRGDVACGRGRRTAAAGGTPEVPGLPSALRGR